MNHKLQPLFGLQDLDAQIVQLRRERTAAPQTLEPHQNALDESKARTETLQNQLKDLKQKIAKAELSLAEADEKIKKLTIQSNQVKKNDEYQTLMKEINQVRADKSRTEDGILESYSQVDQFQSEIKKSGEESQGFQAALDSVKKQVDARTAEIDQKLKALSEGRQKLSEAIDRETLKVYERILGAKSDGIALAEVIDEYCQGCHMNITSQDINLIMMGKDLIFCKACSRILFIGAQPSDVPQKA